MIHMLVLLVQGLIPCLPSLKNSRTVIMRSDHEKSNGFSWSISSARSDEPTISVLYRLSYQNSKKEQSEKTSMGVFYRSLDNWFAGTTCTGPSTGSPKLEKLYSRVVVLSTWCDHGKPNSFSWSKPSAHLDDIHKVSSLSSWPSK